MAFPTDHIQPVGNVSDFTVERDQNSNTYATLGGVALVAKNMFNSNAFQNQFDIGMNGSLASEYSVFHTGATDYAQTQDACKRALVK